MSLYNSGGILDETRHLYYSEPQKWQVLEERIDSSSDPAQQFIWGLRYVDDLILRDRDTTDPANGTLDERLYALQDANWNMTALSNTSGAIQERYAYAAYGSPVFLTSTFGLRTSSTYLGEFGKAMRNMIKDAVIEEAKRVAREHELWEKMQKLLKDMLKPIFSRDN